MFVVGISASAGGLKAFESFFKNMPPKSGMAFIIISHMNPAKTSMLPDIIQKYTQMPVRHAEDGMKIKKNCVYIITPNKNLSISDGMLQLITPSVDNELRLPIDFFFHSLAEDQQEKAIGIILSGMGSDGSEGIKHIKKNMGLTLAQSPETAAYPSMPEHAIAEKCIDLILPPEDMPQQLINYSRHMFKQHSQMELNLENETHMNDLEKILVLLHKFNGHDFSNYKRSTIMRRIEKKMSLHKINKLSIYLRYLQENPDEIKSLFKALLIGVTSFFRDAKAFEVLKQTIIPKLIERKLTDLSIRIWVPGCSTGEEAYSIAIVLWECLDMKKLNFNFQIFGTDIDTDAIEKARIGRYPSTISADVPREILDRFFTNIEGEYRINKFIRERMIFSSQDIIKDPPFSRLDLISCRNLLIYLDSELQQKVLNLFYYSLHPGGILFLGASETIGKFINLFEVLDSKWRFFERKTSGTLSQSVLNLPLSDKNQYSIVIPRAREKSITHIAEKIILEQNTHPCVIIDHDYNILYINGHIDPYLSHTRGEPRLNILDMARESFKIELSSALRRVFVQKKEFYCPDLKIKHSNYNVSFNLIVKPVKYHDISQELVLVAFEENRCDRVKIPKLEKTVSGKDKGYIQHVQELEKELKYTKQTLQATIEELETSNEEITSSNEELQSTIEELQSSNEELETSKEEMQSLNEELMIVNNELQDKIDKLFVANNEILNLLNSIDIPILFLDKSLNIIRFTTKTKEIINLLPSDIGRPVSHIVFNLKYNNLMNDARDVLENLTRIDMEVESNDNRKYQMKILPYRTIENRIEGVAVIFLEPI